jgi:osmotically-inducible protein OsmY
MLSDSQLGQSVSWQLHWDEGCKHADITADVEDGVVILSGLAHSEREHQAARRATLRATGIIDLLDEIVVAPAVASVGRG